MREKKFRKFKNIFNQYLEKAVQETFKQPDVSTVVEVNTINENEIADIEMKNQDEEDEIS